MRTSKLRLLYSQGARGSRRYSTLRRYSENDELAEKLDLSDFESAVESLQAIAEEARAQSRRKRYYSDEEDAEEDAVDPEHEEEVLRIAAPFLKALNISPRDLENMVDRASLQSSRNRRWSRFAESQSSTSESGESKLESREDMISALNDLHQRFIKIGTHLTDIIDRLNKELTKYKIDQSMLTRIKNNTDSLIRAILRLINAAKKEPEKLFNRIINGWVASGIAGLLSGIYGMVVAWTATELALKHRVDDITIFNKPAMYLQDLATKYITGADIKQILFIAGTAAATSVVGLLVSRVVAKLLDKMAFGRSAERVGKTIKSVDRVNIMVAEIETPKDDDKSQVVDINVNQDVAAFCSALDTFLTNNVPELDKLSKSGDLDSLANKMDEVTAKLGTLFADHKKALSKMGINLQEVGAEVKEELP